MSSKRKEKFVEDSLLDPVVEDQLVEVVTDTQYVLVQTASQRGRSKLVDSNGYTYVVMRETSAGATHWRCSKRNKMISCRAAVVQQGPHSFAPRGSEHCHPPDPSASTLMDVAAMSDPASWHLTVRRGISGDESAVTVKSRKKSAKRAKIAKHHKDSSSSDSEVGDEITPERTKPHKAVKKKKKKGRKSLGLNRSQLKKKKREQSKRFKIGRVRIGAEQHERWSHIKESLGFKSDQAVAKFLMDRYENSLKHLAVRNSVRREKNGTPDSGTLVVQSSITCDVPYRESSSEDTSDEESTAEDSRPSGHSPPGSVTECRHITDDIDRALQGLESA